MIVGIPGAIIGGNGFGVTIPYIEFIRDLLKAEDIRILSVNSPIFKDLDLLLLQGGADVNPTRYGDTPGFYTDKPDLVKEYFDVFKLPRYIELKIPIFGICRGLQTIAVHFGAKLIQNMYHETNDVNDGGKGVHGLALVDSPLKKVKVNSRHHQAIWQPSLSGTPIEVTARHSAFLNHIEAIRIKGHNVAAVQFHPEDLDERSGVDYAMSLINSILKKEG